MNSYKVQNLIAHIKSIYSIIYAFPTIIGAHKRRVLDVKSHSKMFIASLNVVKNVFNIVKVGL